MPEAGQLPCRPQQKFPADAQVFDIRQNHKDLDLPGFTRAETVTNNLLFKQTDMARKCSGADVLSPRFCGDADGAELLFRERVLACLTAHCYALLSVFR